MSAISSVTGLIEIEEMYINAASALAFFVLRHPELHLQIGAVVMQSKERCYYNIFITTTELCPNQTLFELYYSNTM